jgi:hypothetical protein
LIPAKVWREWNALFIANRALFDDESHGVDQRQQHEQVHAQTVVEEESLKLLDEGDFNEYRNMIGEWEPPAMNSSAVNVTHAPPDDNPVFGFIVDRLHHLVHPSAVGRLDLFRCSRLSACCVSSKDRMPPPLFPAFGLKIVAMGKSFSGKSTVLKRYAEGKPTDGIVFFFSLSVCSENDVNIINVQQLLREAIDAFNSQQTLDEQVSCYSSMRRRPTAVAAMFDGSRLTITVSTDATRTRCPTATSIHWPISKVSLVRTSARIVIVRFLTSLDNVSIDRE